MRSTVNVLLECIVAAAILLASATPGRAAEIVDQIFVTDCCYQGNVTLNIYADDTGSAAIKTWRAADYYGAHTIYFTVGGIVNDVLFTAGGDNFEFDGRFSGVAAIGTICSPSSGVTCLPVTGGIQDLASFFDFAFGDNIEVQIGDVAPEPSTWMLLMSGLALAGLLGRRAALRGRG